MSDDQDKTRNAAGVKFSSFTEVQPEDGNPIEVVGLRDGTNVRAKLTTDLIETNPSQFRDRNGRFKTAPEETEGLTNQRSVNEFLWNRVQEGIAEQDTIKDKVTALEGAVGEHSLLFTMDDPEGPQFTITDGMSTQNRLSEASFITLPSVDRNGSTIALERISQGDVLRMSDGIGEFTELRIDGEPEGNVFPYNKISGDMDRLTDSIPYDFTVFVAFDPAGLATIDYVDAQDDKKLNLDGGTVTGQLVIEVDNSDPGGTEGFLIMGTEDSGEEGKLLRVFHNTGSKPDAVNYHGQVINPNNIVNKAYVDAAKQVPTIWTYRADTLSPGDGEFSWKAGYSDSTLDLIIGNRTSDGILWVEGHGRQSDSSFDDSFFVTVTRGDGNFMLIADCYFIEWSRKSKSWSYVGLDEAEWEIDLVDGEQYCIQIPGLLPLVKF